MLLLIYIYLYTIKSSILSEQFNYFWQMHRVVHLLPPSIWEHFNRFQKVPSCLTALNPRSYLQPQATTHQLSVLRLFWTFPIIRIIQYVVFCIWCFSRSMFLRFIHVTTCHKLSGLFFYYCWIVFCSSSHQLIGIWTISSLGLLWIVLLWRFEDKFLHRHLILLIGHRYLREWLGRGVSIHLPF